MTEVVNELSLISNLKSCLHSDLSTIVVGAGDDTAVLKTNDPQIYQLLTVDAQVEDVHFRRRFITAEQLGWRAITVNVSDIAAMGGEPTFGLVSLMLPKEIDQEFILHLYKGIEHAGKKYGVNVVGGNISRADKLIIDVSMLGNVQKERLIMRKGACAGDLVFVTGYLGDSAAGFMLLEKQGKSGDKIVDFDNKNSEYLVSRHISPVARLKEAPELSKLGVTAMIDVSDGVTKDISHIAEASRVGVELWQDKLPLAKELSLVSKKLNQDPYVFALSGGEDYELLFTAPARQEEKIVDQVKKNIGTKVSVIGKILEKSKGKWLVTKAGKRIELKDKGWDHFDQLQTSGV